MASIHEIKKCKQISQYWPFKVLYDLFPCTKGMWTCTVKLKDFVEEKIVAGRYEYWVSVMWQNVTSTESIKMKCQQAQNVMGVTFQTMNCCFLNTPNWDILRHYLLRKNSFSRKYISRALDSFALCFAKIFKISSGLVHVVFKITFRHWFPPK